MAETCSKTTSKYYCAFVCIDIVVIPQDFNPLNAELNPICHLLALLGAHPILHVSRIRVNLHMCMKQNK